MKSIKHKIENKILSHEDFYKIWSIEDFKKYSRLSVAKAFSELYKEGKLKRVKRGYYYRFKKTILGETTYDNYNLAIAKIADKASFYCFSGLYGYNKLGFTTQVPNTITIACNCESRNIDNIRYIFREKPVEGGVAERIVLDAIMDINTIPDTTPKKTIEHIRFLIKQGHVNLSSLVKTAFKERPRVRAVIGAIAEDLGFDKNILEKLRKTIHENSMVYLNIDCKHAMNWQIKPKGNLA